MRDPLVGLNQPVLPLSPANQASLRALVRAIAGSQGSFSLILVRGNYRPLRDRITAALVQQLPVPLRQVVLSPQTTTLYSAIRRELGGEQPAALLVHGLEAVQDLGKLLRLANQSREEFRNHLPCPLAIWITDRLLQRLIREATDFESWASISLPFESEPAELAQFIRQTSDQVFAHLLSSRENVFLDSQALNLDQDSPLRHELQTACQALQSLEPEPELEPELAASMAFLLGRVADNTQPVARQHYEQSLSLWQQAGNLERCGHVQFYLGLWWGNRAARFLAERPEALKRARSYLEDAIATFEQLERSDLIGKFVNFLGEVLHRQQAWSALELLALQALELHRQSGEGFRQAKALGLLAEAAIARDSWSQAESLAAQALDCWQQAAIRQVSDPALEPAPPSVALRSSSKALLEWERSFHRPWYLYSLAQAQSQLGKTQEAVQHLEEAQKTAKASYDPDLYSHILDQLRELYFEQKRYLEAYKTRQARREIQGKFNLRAFIGAGRLQASQVITNPSLPALEADDQIAPEILASGRQKDVDALLQRIERKDYRLTVMHGPSGVGKSSILQAGLVPALKQQSFDGRRVVPVLQQVYTHWIQELGHQLASASQSAGVGITPGCSFSSLDEILQLLRQNEAANFKTILIFDQFEEFFFANPSVEGRRLFYQFAVEWFKILDVEVILCMREDYIHYLLICNRMSGLEIIGNNILDKSILYYIGNFTKAETYTLVQARTAHTNVKFEPSLIDQIVQDLGSSFDEIRPIELQIVGAQLQSDNITTLAQYRALAEHSCEPKEILVNRYLESVVRDCGAENQEIAEIVLYLLTSEDGTRPIKTKSELMQEKLYLALKEHPGRLDLVLEIFVRSGLVLVLPSAPTESYQLVHDYLVTLIREKVQSKYQEKIERLERRVAGLDKTIRWLALLLLSVCSAGLAIGLLYQKNTLLYKVTQLERDAIENLSKFNGYQLFSLEKALQSADQLAQNPDLEDRTTLPAYTLQHIIDNIAEKKRLNTGQGRLLAAAASPDGRLIAAAGDDSIKLLDQGGQLLSSTQVPASIWDLRFSADSSQLWSLDAQGHLTRWQVEASQLQRRSQVRAHPAGELGFARMALSVDRQHLATVGEDGQIKLWDPKHLRLISRWRRPGSSPAGSLRFDPSGSYLAAGDYSGVISLWRINGAAAPAGRSLVPPPASGPSTASRAVNYLAFSPDGKLLAAAYDDGLVRVWDFASGQFLYGFIAHDGRRVTAVEFAPAEPSGAEAAPLGYRLVSADEAGALRTWALSAAGEIQLRELRGHQGWVGSLSFERLGGDQPLLVSTSVEGTVAFWQIERAGQRAASLLRAFLAHPGDGAEKGLAWSVSVSPDGQLLATSGANDTAKIWRLSDLARPEAAIAPPIELRPPPRPQAACQSVQTDNDDVFWVAFSPAGDAIATASADCTARLWSLDGQLKAVLPHQDGLVNSIAFGPLTRPGQLPLLASVDSQGYLYLWSATDGRLLGAAIAAHPGRAIYAVKFSPDGRRLATASDDGTVKLWQIEPHDGLLRLAERPIAVLEGHRNGATGIDFSQDGLMATAARDGVVRIWSLAQLARRSRPQPLAELIVHLKAVSWVQFDASGELLATASKDGSVVVWERSLQNWGLRQPGTQFKLRHQFEGHQDGAFSVGFRPQGKGRSQQLAVAQGDGQIKLWQLESTAELIERGCSWLTDPPSARAVDARPDLVAICQKK